MILVDTSAWVEYDRATGSTTDHRVAALITAENALAVTEPIVMEVLAGHAAIHERRNYGDYYCGSRGCHSMPSWTSMPRPGSIDGVDKRAPPRGG